MRAFENGDHKVIWGDAIEALRSHVADGSVDLIFADPPYNIGKDFHGHKDKWPSDEGYLDWCRDWINLCAKKLRPTGSFYLMASTQCMPFLDIHLRSLMTILSRIVWFYDSSGVQAKRYFGSLYEPILFCVKNPDHYTFNAKDIMVDAKTGSQRRLIDYRKPVPTIYNSQKVPGNVWEIARVRYRMEEYEEHPTQKPVALLERIVSASSKPGDLVLDPFSGTFTTSYVAQKLGRMSVGIERQEPYVKIGLRRLGIQTHFNGVPIERLEKTYVRKNGLKNSGDLTLPLGLYDRARIH
jgi:site-specific DNA-methyltransferase (adenine-specific)